MEKNLGGQLKLNPKLDKKIIKLYKKLYIGQIAKMYHVSYTCIRNILIKHNIELRKRGFCMRKIFFNENFFDIINASYKAYFLGLLYADGYNNNKYSARVTLHKKDIDLLKTISSIIKYKGKIHLRKNVCELIMCSSHLTAQLTKLGCVKAKSLILKFPTPDQVPPHLIRHFIRGYFDGDGYLGLQQNKYLRVSITSSNNFIKYLEKFLNNLSIDTNLVCKKGKRYSELYIKTQEGTLKFLHFIYQNKNKMYLKRKYDIYKTFPSKYKNIITVYKFIEGIKYKKCPCCNKYLEINKFFNKFLKLEYRCQKCIRKV